MRKEISKVRIRWNVIVAATVVLVILSLASMLAAAQAGLKWVVEPALRAGHDQKQWNDTNRHGTASIHRMGRKGVEVLRSGEERRLHRKLLSVRHVPFNKFSASDPNYAEG